MKKIKLLSVVLGLGIVLTGCNNTQKGLAIGAGGGAVVGGIIGKLAGNTAVGAAIGGAVGAGAGAIIGNRMSENADVITKAFDSINSFSVRMICYGASKHNLCFLLKDGDTTEALNALHKQLLED